MDIKASYNWIKELVLDVPEQDVLARELSLHGPSVERAIDWTVRFAHMVVGKILAIEPHPDADRLKVVRVDVGDGEKTVVCGGSNLSLGMKIAFAHVGAKVHWHGQADLVTLEPAKIRGVQSEGMICAASELEIPVEEKDREIWDLHFVDAVIGTPLAEALHLNDIVYDIEITTNRADWLGMLGIAREAAAITKNEMNFEDSEIEQPKNDAVEMQVTNSILDDCRVYHAAVLDGIQMRETPIWMKARLWQQGIKTINIVVDITNYVLSEYGQPMHAFDYAKIAGSHITVRHAQKGERFLALDHVEYKLRSEDIVIADQQSVIALGGVIGGKESAVSPETTRVVLESAHFTPFSVRKTARAHGIATLSAQHFEKNMPHTVAELALHSAISLLQEYAGAQLVNKVITKGVEMEDATIPFPLHFIPERIGVTISTPEVVDYLSALGFGVAMADDDDVLLVAVPYWRSNDILGWHDLIEEVARMYGYYKLPAEMPTGSIPNELDDPRQLWASRAKHALAGMGLIELYTYSFFGAKDLVQLGKAPEDVITVLNPLSEDYVYMRPSLLPNMLQSLAVNQAQSQSLQLFELSNIYIKKDGASLPDELKQLAIGVSVGGDGEQSFYRLKGIVMQLFALLGIRDVRLSVGEDSSYFVPRKYAILEVGTTPVAEFGLVASKLRDAYGIKREVAVALVDFEQVIMHAHHVLKYTPIPEYPEVKLDLSIVVDEQILWHDVQAVVLTSAADLARSVALFDTYRGDELDDGKKSLAFSISYRSDEKTLSMQDVEAVNKKVISALKKQLHATLRESV